LCRFCMVMVCSIADGVGSLHFLYHAVSNENIEFVLDVMQCYDSSTSSD